MEVFTTQAAQEKERAQIKELEARAAMLEASSESEDVDLSKIDLSKVEPRDVSDRQLNSIWSQLGGHKAPESMLSEEESVELQRDPYEMSESEFNAQYGALGGKQYGGFLVGTHRRGFGHPCPIDPKAHENVRNGTLKFFHSVRDAFELTEEEKGEAQ